MCVPTPMVRKNFAAVSTKIFEKPTRTGFRLAGPRDNPTTGVLDDYRYCALRLARSHQRHNDRFPFGHRRIEESYCPPRAYFDALGTAMWDARWMRMTLKANWISYPRMAEPKEALEGRARISRLYRANQNFIPNCGDRYRHGEKTSTAFTESAVSQVVSKRMVKKQQIDGLSQARTIYFRCGRRCSMTNSGRASFADIRECKLNKETEIQKDAA
jgi:hypothetical protein